MFIPDANDIVRARAVNTKLTDGDSVKWIHDGITASGLYRQYVTPSASTWSKTNAAEMSIDFRIDTAGEYYIMLLVSTGNSECSVWVEVDGKRNEVGENNSGRLSFLFSYFGVSWLWDNDSGNSQVTLDVGRHNIKIRSITDGLFIQDIVIAPIASTGLFGNVPVPFELYSHNGNDVDPVLISPKDGDLIGPRSQRFRFAENQKTVDSWRLHLGTTPGADDIWSRDWSFGNDYGIQSSTTSVLPYDGSPIYFSYWSLQGGVWVKHDDRVFRAHDPRTPVQNYSDWLIDSNNDPYRALLFELDHASGTTYLSSEPYISDKAHIIYDDFLVNSPYITTGLGKTIEVGDIEVINPVLEENYFENDYHGHRCRAYYGDVRWPRVNFRRVASAIIDDVRELGDRHYVFDLVDESFKYDVPYPNFKNDLENASTFKNALKFVSDLWDLAGAYEFLNVSDYDLLITLRYQINSSTTIRDLIDRISDSLNVEWRISQTGVLELIKPDLINQTSVTFTEDNIDIDGIRKVDSIHPVYQIRINFDNEQHYIHAIETDTASLAEELVVDTYLIEPVEAVNLARELEKEYVNRHDIYEIKVIGFGDLTQEGDVVTVRHPRLTGTGVVQHIQRYFLENYSLVEVRF